MEIITIYVEQICICYQLVLFPFCFVYNFALCNCNYIKKSKGTIYEITLRINISLIVPESLTPSCLWRPCRGECPQPQWFPRGSGTLRMLRLPSDFFRKYIVYDILNNAK